LKWNATNKSTEGYDVWMLKYLNLSVNSHKLRLNQEG